MRFASLSAAIGAVIVLFGLGAGSADAAVCNADALGKISPSTGCDVGTTNNSSPSQLNTDQLFGFTGWSFIAKDNDLNGTDEGTLTALTISGNKKVGSWSIAQSVFDTYANVVIVLKGGNGNNTNPNYIGYLVTSLTGSYGTPFFNQGSNHNAKDISHVALYGQGTPVLTQVPLPATGLLLVGGLGLLGAMRRKRA